VARRAKYDPFNDYYVILGVNPSASPEQIQSAFRERAKAVHPDRNADPQAKELFQRLNEAYDILTDPQRRAEFDRQRAAAGFGPRYTGPNFRRNGPLWRAVIFGLWRGPYRVVFLILIAIMALNAGFILFTSVNLSGNASPADSNATSSPLPIVPLPGPQRPASSDCPANARIDSPADNTTLSGTFAIAGNAQGTYELDWATVLTDPTGRPQPFNWQLLVRSTTLPTDHILADETLTAPLPHPAELVIRLIVTPGNQQSSQICQIAVHLS